MITYTYKCNYIDETESNIIKDNMKKLNITYNDIANDLDYSRSYVSMVIRGKRCVQANFINYLINKKLYENEEIDL